MSEPKNGVLTGTFITSLRVLRDLGLDRILGRERTRERDLVVELVCAPCFGIEDVVFVCDRGMITQTQVDETGQYRPA